MGIVKAAKLVYEYIRRDEEENIEEVKRAIDGVDVDIKRVILWLCWAIMVPASLPWLNM